MRPEDALDTQRQMLEFWRSDNGKRYADGWIRSFTKDQRLMSPEDAPLLQSTKINYLVR